MAAVVLALDIVTKVLAVKLLTPGQPVSIIGDTVTWTLVRNSGAAFSMATGYTWVLTLVALGVVVGIIWMGRRLVSPWWAIGLGMILGGALGNLVDRFFRSPGPLRGRRGLPVDRVVAGVQRGRPGRRRRGDPAGGPVGVRLRVRRPGPPESRPPDQRRPPDQVGRRVTERSMPIPEGLAGMRVDAGLARLLGLSRTAAAAVAEDGGVEIDGNVVGKSDRLEAGAWLSVRLPEERPRWRTTRSRSRA